ncbi:MAG: hypothetical protein IT366_18735 [Candidatus Hydrogenedentes bacterium]|nr:hypothetical protein [Candidatus Hydrogenedentota bacterium]
MRSRKLFHYARVIVIALFLLVVYAIQVYAAAGESEPSSNSPLAEPGIFARVLKESLDSAGLGKFVSGPFGVRSPIETGIQSDYIPTVGLLVRVPVSFPISAPAKTDSPAEAKQGHGDLWEKYSDAGSRAGQHDRIIKLQKKIDTRERINLNNPNAMVHREEIRIDNPENIHLSVTGDELEDVGKLFVERFTPKVDIMIDGFLAAPYEESRVTNLREVILDVVAQYGHRVSSVQDGERIIVVVEAPMPGNPARIMIGEEDREPSWEFAPFHARLDGTEERMLIAVPKAAIASASTREAIVGQVTERRY